MPKKILEDIKPLTKTRKSVSSASVSKIKTTKKKDEISDSELDIRINSYDSNLSFLDTENNNFGNRKTTIIIWAIATLSIVFLFFILASVFSSATIEIKPKSVSGPVDISLLAEKDSSSNLSYQIMSISDEESQIVKSNKKETVEERAKGVVIIYNEFSEAKQSLLIDTRLETKDGKIYKTEKAIVVPGYTKKGTEIIPGSVEVAVYADVAGIEYNKDTADFKIFGFKGTPKYEKFYARSKGKIDGGYSGERFVLDPELSSQIINNLENKLRDRLNSSINSQIPNGYIVFNGGVVFKIDDISPEKIFGKTEEFNVSIKGNALAYIFEERQIAMELAKRLVSQYDESPVYISNKKDLNMKIDSTTSLDTRSIKFKLIGEPVITWVLDIDSIRNSLLGISKKSFEETISVFSGIERGKLLLKPHWKNILPKDSKKVKIQIIDEN